MSNNYYNHTSAAPGQNTFGASATMRAEFDAIVNAFNLLPSLGGGVANQVVVVNNSGTALVSTASPSLGSPTFTSILGDMTNATLTSRLFAQSTVVNGVSDPLLLPNGAATQAAWWASNNSVPTNSAIGKFGIDAVSAFVDSGIAGSGTQLPFQVRIGGTSYLAVGTAGNVTVNAPSSGTAVAISGGSVASVPLTVATSVATTMQTWNDGTVNTELLQFTDNNLYFGNTTNHAMQLVTNNIGRVAVAAAGNVTINAPASGNAFTANDSGNGAVGNFLGNLNGGLNLAVTNSNGGASAQANITLTGSVGTLTFTAQGTGGGTSGDIYASAASTFRLTAANNSGTIALCTSASFSQRLLINGTGNVTVNAPASGVSLAVSGVSTAGVAAFSSSTGGNGYAANLFGSTSGANWPATTNQGLYIGTNFTGGSSEVVFVNSNTAATTAFDFRQQTGASAGRLTLSIASTGAVTLSSPSSGNHQFNGLTQYSDGTTNAEIGWRGTPVKSVSNATYTFVVADRGMDVQNATSGSNTVNASVFSAGDIILLTNFSGGNLTVNAGASVTLKLAGTSNTGTRTVTTNTTASIRCVVGGGTPTFFVSGPGVT